MARRYYDVLQLELLNSYTVVNLFVDVNCQYGPHLRNIFNNQQMPAVPRVSSH